MITAGSIRVTTGGSVTSLVMTAASPIATTARAIAAHIIHPPRGALKRALTGPDTDPGCAAGVGGAVGCAIA
jgi:hypothetical protein